MNRRIIGIDPGSVSTGYGIVDVDGKELVHIDNNVIKVLGSSFPERLGFIFSSISDLLELYKPTEFAIETAFVHKNPSSALKLGQARSAAICAAVMHKVTVSEYAPRTIKLVATGSGAADKKQIVKMMQLTFGVVDSLPEDAADGLAIAVCHAHHSASATFTNRTRRRAGKRWAALPPNIENG